MPYGAIKSFDMNTLQSNNPIEDAHAEATVKNGSGNSTKVIKGRILKITPLLAYSRLLVY